MAKTSPNPTTFYSRSGGLWRVIHTAIPVSSDKGSLEEARRAAEAVGVQPDPNVFWNGDRGVWDSLVAFTVTTYGWRSDDKLDIFMQTVSKATEKEARSLCHAIRKDSSVGAMRVGGVLINPGRVVVKRVSLYDLGASTVLCHYHWRERDLAWVKDRLNLDYYPAEK